MGVCLLRLIAILILLNVLGKSLHKHIVTLLCLIHIYKLLGLADNRSQLIRTSFDRFYVVRLVYGSHFLSNQLHDYRYSSHCASVLVFDGSILQRFLIAEVIVPFFIQKSIFAVDLCCSYEFILKKIFLPYFNSYRS